MAARLGEGICRTLAYKFVFDGVPRRWESFLAPVSAHCSPGLKFVLHSDPGLYLWLGFLEPHSSGRIRLSEISLHLYDSSGNEGLSLLCHIQHPNSPGVKNVLQLNQGPDSFRELYSEYIMLGWASERAPGGQNQHLESGATW